MQTYIRILLLYYFIIPTLSQAQIPKNDWPDSFGSFQKALITHDVNHAKTFFSFPILNSEIWYRVKPMRSESDAEKLTQETPFTEKDFENYFDTLFDAGFIRCLSDINPNELQEKSKDQSKDLIRNGRVLRLSAKWLKDTNSIRLTFTMTNKQAKISTSHIFDFRITADGKLEFDAFMIVG